MNRSHLVRLVLAAAAACLAAVTYAQQSLEIIPLRHRTVEQVLPVLQPLVEPGGTLSGSRGQLIVRASPGNLAEIRRALDAIDRVDQRLQVVEGGRAMIFTGSSNNYRETTTGIEVVPRLAGGNVTLDIYQQRERQAASTTITTRLGEWTELGGTASSAARDERGIASAGRVQASEARRVWVKVEALD